MFNFNSLGISVPLSPLTHTDSRPFFTTLLDCTCTFSPLQLHSQLSVVKTAIPKLTFASSSQRLLPLQELHLSVDDGEASHHQDYNHSEVSVDSYLKSYLSNADEEAVGLSDSLKSLSKKVLKERMRRLKIGLANKGRVPWNKGRKHTAETRERIKQRTLEALRDPKVRKKMSEHPQSHSDQVKAKISYSVRRVWQERLKSKRFFLSWQQSIANAARKGGSGQQELDWDSYKNIKRQLELQQLLQAEEKKKEKLTAIAGKKFIQSWWESIAEAAKKGGGGEQELEWDSYEMMHQEMVLLHQLQRTAEKAKAKEMTKVRAEKAARVKAIKKVILTKRRKDRQGRTKAREDKKDWAHRKAKQGKDELEVAQEFKLHPKLTKMSKNISSQVARGDVFNSLFPSHKKLDLEFIRREKMQKEVSLAELIQAARDKKGKVN